MLEKDHGHIVSIASCAGLGGVRGLCDYCSSKFGAVGFQESLHMELKAMEKNIHTTVVCPYFINTGMFDGVQTRCDTNFNTHLFFITIPNFFLSLNILKFFLVFSLRLFLTHS